MSGTTPGPAPVARGEGLARAVRAAVAPVLSGAAGAIVFLIMIQGAFRQGYTTLDFNHVLGTLIQGQSVEVGTTDEALGVIGDSVGPTGLWATILCGIGLMVVHELVITRLVRRPWPIQAIPLSALTILAVGVLYTGLADARFDTPIGFFGTDAGDLTPLVIVLCSIGFAIIGARVHKLSTRASWWEPRPDPFAEARLEDVGPVVPRPERPGPSAE